MPDLTLNSAKHRVEVSVGQFVDLPLMVKSEREMRDAITTILRDRADFDLLICFDGVGPASQEASVKLGEMMAHFNDRLGKAAHIGFSPLAMLQTRRIANNDPRFQFFDDRASAEAWLDA